MPASMISADPFPNRELVRLGRRVAAARHESGLTLSALAERTGVSAAFISQIESGTANPTARTLVQLASAFGLGLAELFGAASDATSAAGSFEPRAGGLPRAATVPDARAVFDLTAVGSSALAVRLLHADAADHAVPVAHAGEEFVLVLAGTCVLHVGDTLTRHLGPFDHCHFPAGTAHHVTGPSDDLLMLVVFTQVEAGGTHE